MFYEIVHNSYRQTAPSIAYLLQDWCYVRASTFHGMQQCYVGANPIRQSLLETKQASLLRLAVHYIIFLIVLAPR
jgi:hypothetical protein